MGRGMKDKPKKEVPKSGGEWFSSHFRRIFKREGKPDTYKNNLEQMYRKYEGESQKHARN